ncbi:hypothetical protein POPTR_010G200301v4 [Populus trichocarpa]|uniref:Uncharacterized protein n=1 Tax=Populus trichocarpa TaxID=3694 RepID=A0ACC0SEI6_POPTR|nr:hypothetical protein BDE02_10G178800 [Populus trichocarpa]KAI9387614.1 hypothetical protein POPTR_010G200301v4 [Populus trichocarpa]
MQLYKCRSSSDTVKHHLTISLTNCKINNFKMNTSQSTFCKDDCLHFQT